MQEEGFSHLEDAGNRNSLIVTSVDERAMKRSSNGFVEMIQRAQQRSKTRLDHAVVADIIIQKRN